MSLIILENQIKEDIDYESNFEVRFVLFILGVLLCLIIKLVVQHSFLHTLENTASINKMNYGELIFSFSLCITSKSSTLTNKVMFLIVYCVLSCFKLFYHEHVSFEKMYSIVIYSSFSLLVLGEILCFSRWNEDIKSFVII